ncbi:MAG: hypothetical protein Q9215_008083 [Flavoplaca cf. flavocitrina]
MAASGALVGLAVRTIQPSPPSPPASSTPPDKSSTSSEAKIAVAICVPYLTILFSLAAYWVWNRRKTRKRLAKPDNLPTPSTRPMSPHSPAHSDNSHSYVREMPSVNNQGLEAGQTHETNDVVTSELEMSPCDENTAWLRRWMSINHNKPLPGLPPELTGSSICKELEGDTMTS